jgi:hypothetical protein
MSRFLFVVSAMAVFLSCTSAESTAQAASNSVSAQNDPVLPQLRLSPDAAVAAARSKERNPTGASFQVIRELDSSAEMQQVAQRSLREATSQQSLYGDGIFLDLLRTGGFLVLEVDDSTGNALWLHLVSSGTNGRAVIRSRPVEGKVNANLAKELVKETADFVDSLFASPLDVSTIESRFYRGRFPDSDEPEEEGFFAIPGSIQKITADQSEIRELSALFGAFHLWPVRYAISMPIFPANPTTALNLAWDKQKALTKEFIHTNNKNSDLVDDLQSLESVQNSEQIRERVDLFRNLDSFLEQKLQSQDIAPTFAVNKSIFTIASEIGSTEPPESSYAVMTASGLIVVWKPLKTGGLAITRVSLAGD